MKVASTRWSWSLMVAAVAIMVSAGAAEAADTAKLAPRAAGVEPIPATMENPGIPQVIDGSFEAGSPNPYWTEYSLNFGTPLCTIASCGTGTGTGPLTGDWWTWFGGIATFEEGSVSQSVPIPLGVTTLEFWLEMIVCDSPSDYMEITIDGTQVYLVDGSSPLCGVLGYSQQQVDVSAFADGASHTLEFHSEVFGTNAGNTNFFVDDVSLLEPLTPPNDLCVDAIQLTCPSGGGTAVVQGSTATATFTDQGTCVTSHTAPEVWYKVTGNGGGMSVTTCSGITNYDTKLTVWDGACDELFCVDGNDDDGGCTFSTLQSTVAWSSVSGTEYYIMVHGFSGGTGDFELTLTCDIPVELQSLSIE